MTWKQSLHSESFLKVSKLAWKRHVTKYVKVIWNSTRCTEHSVTFLETLEKEEKSAVRTKTGWFDSHCVEIQIGK